MRVVIIGGGGDVGFSVHGSHDNSMLLYTVEYALPDHTLYTSANYSGIKLVADT